jgi:hypothetical protein
MEPSHDRIKSLAQSLDCIADEDFCALADIKLSTSEAWRKRGKGPAYILLGNRYLYPRKAVADYLQTLVRERHSASAKGSL